MECYRLNGQSSKCWGVHLPDTDWRVCADKEDGAVEVIETPFTYTISVVCEKWGWGELK